MLILFLLHHPRLISKPLYKLCQCLLHLPLMLSPNCQHSSSTEKHLVFATNVVLSGVKITAAHQRNYMPYMICGNAFHMLQMFQMPI